MTGTLCKSKSSLLISETELLHKKLSSPVMLRDISWHLLHIIKETGCSYNEAWELFENEMRERTAG